MSEAPKTQEQLWFKAENIPKSPDQIAAENKEKAEKWAENLTKLLSNSDIDLSMYSPNLKKVKEEWKEGGKKLGDILHPKEWVKEWDEKELDKVKNEIIDKILEDKYGEFYKIAIEKGQTKEELREKYLEDNEKKLNEKVFDKEWNEMMIKDKYWKEINKTKYDEILEKNENLAKLNTEKNLEFTKELLVVYGVNWLSQYEWLIKEAWERGEKLPSNLEEFDKFIKGFSIENPEAHKKHLEALVDNWVITQVEWQNRIKWISNAEAHSVKAQPLPENFEWLSWKEKSLALIKHFEWFSPKSYWDYKQYTWGYGTKAPWAWTTISEEKATQELSLKVDSDYNLNNYLSSDIMNKLWDNQKTALTSFIFNLWPWKINNFKSLLNWYPDTAQKIANKMERYNKAGWEILKWLVSRRKTESKLFLTKNLNDKIEDKKVETKA